MLASLLLPILAASTIVAAVPTHKPRSHTFKLQHSHQAAKRISPDAKVRRSATIDAIHATHMRHGSSLHRRSKGPPSAHAPVLFDAGSCDGGFYRVPVSFGTPGQTLNLTLDTLGSDLIVQSANGCLTEDCLAESFNANASSTFKSLDENVYVGYANGTKVTDQVTLGSITWAPQEFITVPNERGYPSGQSGYLGLGLADPASGLEAIWAENARLTTEPAFAFKLNRRPAYALGGSEWSDGGEFSLGTYNEVLVSEPLNWIPVNSNSTWQVQLDGLTVTTFGRGAENIGFTYSPAQIDVNSNVIAGPVKAVRSIFAALPTSEDVYGDGSLWSYDCTSPPVLAFNFGNQTIHMSPRDFGAVDSANSSRCDAAITGWDNDYWSLGTPFLTNVYSIFTVKPSPAIAFSQLDAKGEASA